MENKKDTNPMVVCAVVALIVGIVVGYSYGFGKGKIAAVVAAQQAEEQAAAQAQQQIVEKANPFGTETNSSVNPFTQTYVNPLEGSGNFNPFAQ